MSAAKPASPGLPRRLLRAVHRVYIALGWTVVAGALLVLAAGWLLRLPPSPPATAFRGLVFAHRAQAGDAPENTLAAIRAAHRAGAGAVELDLRLTADGEAVALHDASLDRTTTGRGLVASLRLADVRALDASGARPAFAGERVPTLDEVVALTGELGLALELDVKDVDADVVAARISDALARHDAHGRVFASSFYPQVLHAIRSHDPRVVTALAVRPDATGVALVDRLLLSFWLPDLLGVGLIEPHRALVSEERVAAWRRRGYVVNAWTVNRAEDKAWLRRLGVAYTTNCPGAACADDPSDEM